MITGENMVRQKKDIDWFIDDSGKVHHAVNDVYMTDSDYKKAFAKWLKTKLNQPLTYEGHQKYLAIKEIIESLNQ